MSNRINISAILKYDIGIRCQEFVMLGSPHSYIESDVLAFLPIMNLTILETKIVSSGTLMRTTNRTRKKEYWAMISALYF